MNQNLNVFVKYIISEFCLNQEEKNDKEFYLVLYYLFKTYLLEDSEEKEVNLLINNLLDHLLPFHVKPKEDYLIRLNHEIQNFINTY